MTFKVVLKKSVVALLLLFVVGIGAYYALYPKDSSPRFKTVKVTRGDISAVVTATGTLSAVTTVTVGTQVSGTIKSIYVDYNSPVRQGQVIAQIDPETFIAQVNQARANLNLVKANLQKSEVTLMDAERTLSRYKMLLEKELISRSEYETALTNFESARAQVLASKAQVGQAEAALRVAEINLEHTKIVSPVNGVVVSRNVDVGQTVAASFQTPTLFTIAQDLTKMRVVSSVAEADIGMVKRGQPVEFTVDAYREHTFKGRVSEVRIAPITVQNVVTYEVIILVDNPEYKLKPGMTANVSIVVDSKGDVLKVPNAALRFKMPEALLQGSGQKKDSSRQRGTGTSAVWVLENERPRKVPVKIGISDGQFTEVVSGDIKEDDEVIVEHLSKKGSVGPQRPQQSGPRFF